MKVENWQLKIIFLLLIICFLAFLFSPSILATEPQVWEITVSAAIGEPKLTVFGYTSPQALVELKGIRVSDLTIADTTGYFYFDRVFLPRPNPYYPEICLSAIDKESRVSSFPTCLPPLPPKLAEIRVGPVLLPPTLVLEKGEFLPGEQIKAMGATFPNSPVTIYLANEKRKNFLISQFLNFPISSVYASFLPKYEIKSDKNGNFEFNLPPNQPQKWRVYATAQYLNSPSPKSVTLGFKVLSWWEWLWRKIKTIFGAIVAFFKPNWWWFVIGTEVIILIAILLRKKERRSIKSLALPPPRQLVLFFRSQNSN